MIISATAMIIIFMVIFSELYQDNLRDKKAILAQDFGYSLQNEFMMAAQARSGYSRTFDIPQNLEGFPYDVSIISNVLVINYTDNIFSLPIPEANGIIKKGTNIIANKNNTICINC
jgi:hypothetical protein